ncbi:MAG: hypothetical protein J1E58_09335 [Prevotella sp.]|nr:hypothetical protein [Prevotella sp.]
MATLKIEKDINVVRDCFWAHENSFDKLYSECLKEVAQTQFSKERYYYIYPFENELNRQKRGKLLKKQPSRLKNIHECGFDSEGNLICVTEHISESIRKTMIIENASEYITAFTFIGGNHMLQNVTRIFHDASDQVYAVINWGMYGWRFDRFKYDMQGLLKQVERTAKEHQSDKMTDSTFNLSYANGLLDSITQHYSNGYECKIYP